MVFTALEKLNLKFTNSIRIPTNQILFRYYFILFIISIISIMYANPGSLTNALPVNTRKRLNKDKQGNELKPWQGLNS